MRIYILIPFLLEKWIWFLFAFLLAHAYGFIKSYLSFRPNKLLIHGRSTFFGQWLGSLSYYIIGWRIVNDGYERANKKIFAIPSLNKYHVFVSDPDQIHEVSKAPLTQLSFNAAIDEVGGPAAAIIVMLKRS